MYSVNLSNLLFSADWCVTVIKVNCFGGPEGVMLLSVCVARKYPHPKDKEKKETMC